MLPLDAIATFFIFMIGMPAILLQTLPAEIRRVVQDERRFEVALFTLGPLLLAGLVVGLGAYLTYRVIPEHAELLWLGLLGVLLAICGGAALLLTVRWRRSNVIRYLYRDAAVGVIRQGRPIETVVNTLVDVGLQSTAGQDTGLVLDALAALTRDTQRHPEYDGAQLENIIGGLENIFTSGDRPCSADNFNDSAQLLNSIILKSRTRRNSKDLQQAVQATSLLARASLIHEESSIQLKFVEALGLAGQSADPTWATQALLEVGSTALDAGYVLIAMTALDKQETIIGEHCPVAGDMAEDFIGLLAHFWARRESGRQYSLEYLVRADQYFAAPLAEVIAEARARSMKKARFTTCDYLARMLADTEPG